MKAAGAAPTAATAASAPPQVVASGESGRVDPDEAMAALRLRG